VFRGNKGSLHEPACKPGSVRGVGLVTVIYLGAVLPGRSSSLPGSHSGSDRSCFHIWPCSRWGLPSQPVTRLLVGSYPAISPLPEQWLVDSRRLDLLTTNHCSGGIFLLHFPYPCSEELGRWALPTTGVRVSPDFPLSACADSDRPADSWRFFHPIMTRAPRGRIALRFSLTGIAQRVYIELYEAVALPARSASKGRPLLALRASNESG